MAAETAMATPSSTSTSNSCDLGGGDCGLPFLPEEVCLEILYDLPVKSLIRFKLVCKSWLSIIQSIDFVNQRRRKHGCIKDDEHDDSSVVVMYCVHANASDDNDIGSNPLGPAQFSLVSPHGDLCTHLDVSKHVFDCRPCSPVYRMLSFDGIACLYLHDALHWASDIHLWNPATNQTRHLPQPPSPLTLNPSGWFDISVGFGFGFDFKTLDYKVIRIIHPTFDASVAPQVVVYSLNTHSWRTLDTSSFPPVSCIIPSHIKQPVCDGRIFCWFAIKARTNMDEPKGDVYLILWFDFSSEEFGIIPFPDAIVHNHYQNLSVTGGDKITCLNYARHMNVIQEDEFDVWVLNEFGVKESWTKLFRVHCFWSWSRMVSILDDRVSFLIVLKGCLCIHNTVTGKTRKLPRQKKLHFAFDSTRYKQSLVSIELEDHAPNSLSISPSRLESLLIQRDHEESTRGSSKRS